MTSLLAYVALIHARTFPNREATLRMASQRARLTVNSPRLPIYIATTFVDTVLRPYRSTVRIESRELWDRIGDNLVRVQWTAAAGVPTITLLSEPVDDPVALDVDEFVPTLVTQISQPLLLSSSNTSPPISPEQHVPPSQESSSQGPSTSASSSQQALTLRITRPRSNRSKRDRE